MLCNRQTVNIGPIYLNNSRSAPFQDPCLSVYIYMKPSETVGGGVNTLPVVLRGRIRVVEGVYIRVSGRHI